MDIQENLSTTSPRKQRRAYKFDKPSSLFGQFNNLKVTVVTQSLDAKLASLIERTELLATKSQAG